MGVTRCRLRSYAPHCECRPRERFGELASGPHAHVIAFAPAERVMRSQACALGNPPGNDKELSCEPLEIAHKIK